LLHQNLLKQNAEKILFIKPLNYRGDYQCRRQTDDWLFYGEQTVPAMIDALEGYGASKINPADCGLSEKL
jgi:hypothetical protein